jgi:hypothetical protein
MVLVSNGTDIVTAENYVASLSSDNLTLTGTLSVGSTSTFTGAATFTANPTLSGGTANGVLFLNGSKVATSGTALVFDGTNLGLGVSSTTPINGTATFQFQSAGGATSYITTGTHNAFMSAVTGGVASFGTSTGSTVVSIEVANGNAIYVNANRNVGIGTSSPNIGLTVEKDNGSGYVAAFRANNTSPYLTIQTTGGITQIQGINSAFSATNDVAMQLSGGNLGIGTTPLVKFDVKGATDTHVGITASATDEAIILAYDDGGIRTPNLSYAAASHKFLVNTTLAATLDASGNLGLGITPTSGWGSNWKVIDQTSVGSIAATGSGTGDYGFTFNAYNDNTNWKYKYTGGTAMRYRLNESGHAWFTTATTGTAGNAITFTQAMTLDASGNLLVGTTSVVTGVSGTETTLILKGNASGKSASFVVENNAGTGTGYLGVAEGTSLTYLYSKSNHALLLGTNNTERARITSGGDLLVGTTANPQSARLYVLGSGYNATAIRVASNGNVGTSYLNESGTEVGYVQVNASATTYSTSSDRRLKSNIVPAPSASDDIDAIQIVSHDWKAVPNDHVKYGVIAQDLLAVAPQAVSVGDDGDDIERTWGVDYSKLVPMLVKEVQSLRARVAALEAK